MDDFNPNINNEGQEDVTTENVADEVIETSVEAEDFHGEDAPMWNKVEYTPVTKIDDYKPMSKGLKVFCLVMAAVVVLTATAAGGYFLGRSSNKTNSAPKQVISFCRSILIVSGITIITL